MHFASILLLPHVHSVICLVGCDIICPYVCMYFFLSFSLSPSPLLPKTTIVNTSISAGRQKRGRNFIFSFSTPDKRDLVTRILCFLCDEETPLPPLPLFKIFSSSRNNFQPSLWPHEVCVVVQCRTIMHLEICFARE